MDLSQNSNISDGIVSIDSAKPDTPVPTVTQDAMKVESPTKRRGKRLKTTSVPESSPTATCHLDRMPFELLAIILKFTSSSKDVLAVARCSKYYFYTLAGNSGSLSQSLNIWVAVRKTAGIPDPIPKDGWTEIGYAAFLFDGGICEVCEAYTKAGYSSFALRIRLCEKSDCRLKFNRTQVFHPQRQWLSTGDGGEDRLLSFLPVIESTRCLYPHDARGGNWPSITPTCRKADWMNALQEYGRAPATFFREREAQINRLPLIMSFAVALSDWKADRKAQNKSIKSKNEAFAKLIAAKEGWDAWDLLNAPSYASLHRNHNDVLEEITQTEYDLIRPQVEVEIMRTIERRKRRLEEKSLQQRRADIEKHYLRLKTAKSEPSLPPLATFRKLPIVSAIQSKSTSGASELETSEIISQLLKDDLAKWREPAREALAKLLGQEEWKSTSKTELHPVDRLTARFRCTKCEKVAVRYQADGCLNFEGVCEHVCSNIRKKDKRKEVWSAEAFVRDDRAIATVSKVLDLCNVDASDQDSSEAMKKIGARIMCLSCGPIVMDFEGAAGHSHRHDNMDITLLSEIEAASIVKYPIDQGVTAKLLGPGFQAKDYRNEQVYGCRHCTQERMAPSPVVETENGTSTPMVDGGITKESSKAAKANKLRNKLYSLNGMKSHLKGKHGIESDIRDEDFFITKVLMWD